MVRALRLSPCPMSFRSSKLFLHLLPHLLFYGQSSLMLSNLSDWSGQVLEVNNGSKVMKYLSLILLYGTV